MTSSTSTSNFYPRPLRGGRQELCTAQAERLKFLSTPSARRATQAIAEDDGEWEFLSTPSARRATAAPRESPRGAQISIHALCEEGDGCIGRLPHRHNHFYPRPLRGGRRARDLERNSDMIFLSTPSARRATWIAAIALTNFLFLSTPSARRATPQRHGTGGHHPISIHALCEEGDR